MLKIILQVYKLNENVANKQLDIILSNNDMDSDGSYVYIAGKLYESGVANCKVIWNSTHMMYVTGTLTTSIPFQNVFLLLHPLVFKKTYWIVQK